ncbi:hypothetical protein [Mycolicibacterium neoaurum]|uniref:hypothetical protein n=1 Tax=Mycolicibacterium neoaurum TaxID=1795 RepID=UPI00114D4A11|nr:hypothetical protein [Mycolicibacterium neoaurum]
MVAVSVGATLLITRDGGSHGGNADPLTSSDIASANDTSPISIITEDPTCAPWRPIISTLASQQRQGWESRDYSRSRSEWTADEQRLYDAVAKAMLGAADRTAALAKLTTHRVMRELYEQSIAYWRAYADSIPNYRPADNFLAITASDTSDAITSICGAIDNGSAAARGPLIAPQQAATTDGAEDHPNSPERFIGEKDRAFCSQWSDLVKKFEQDTAEWRNWDALSPASEWDPQHQSIMTNATPVFENFADDMASLARSGDNAIVRDFAELSAQYFRAYVKAIPTYDVNDSYLSSVGTLGYLSIFNACASAEV